MIYDIIIIGAGVVGTSIARELSRYKLRIAVLEKEEEAAFGVSKSNSGIIHPGTQNPPHSLKGRLCVQGNMLTRRLAVELGVDFKEVGELIVAFDEEEAGRLRQIKHDGEALGVPRLEMVNGAWLKKHEPNLNPAIIAALHAPTAGIISPYRWVYDLSENAMKNGVEFRTQTKAGSIACRGQDGFEVGTSGGTFRARFVINAAGLFADEVARMAGIDDFTIRPRKGEEFLLDKKKKGLTNRLVFPLPSKTSKGVIMIRTSDGNPMIGPTAVEIEDKYDLATSREGFDTVFASARRMVPGVSENDVIAYFAGLRPTAGDDFIIRSERNVPGFINVAGIQSPGLTAAPAIALYAAGLLKQAGADLKKKFWFHRYRRKEVHLFEIPLARTKKLVRKDKAYGDIICRCEMVSAKEIEDAIARGATTMDGIKFRTRAQAGRCHGSFCATRIMKLLAEKRAVPVTNVTKRGPGSEIVMKDRANAVMPAKSEV